MLNYKMITNLNNQMFIIYCLIIILLWMFMKNHKGGICSLLTGNKSTFIIGAQDCPSDHISLAQCQGRIARQSDSADIVLPPESLVTQADNCNDAEHGHGHCQCVPERACPPP